MTKPKKGTVQAIQPGASNHVQSIGLQQLRRSEKNVRRTGQEDGITELMASILAHGIRQNLNVGQAEDGLYEVIAGQRRLIALQRLAERGDIGPDFPVPCLIVRPGEDAQEISLAENQLRVNMHPDDQFEAFSDLVRRGFPVEDVAARFGVTPAVVKQRLKLAAVSPAIRTIYRAGDMTLEQVMAFTVTDDHTKQEAVWEDVKDSWQERPSGIRKALTEETVAANSRLAKFVTVAAYEEAGGEVIRDLFDTENEGYLADALLLNSLAQTKLEVVAAEVAKEGWKWTEAAPSFDWVSGEGRVWPDSEDDDNDDEAETSTAVYSPEDLAVAGARVSVGYDGEVRIDRGIVRIEDRKAADGEAGSADSGAATKPEYTAKQVEELTGHRSVALRLALAGNERVARVALAYTLALKAFGQRFWIGETALKISLSADPHWLRSENTSDCRAHAEMEAAHEAWLAKLPKEAADLWAWCMEQDDQLLNKLTAFCAAISLDAVVLKHINAQTDRGLRNADQIAEALGFDMAAEWCPTIDGFIGGMSKAQMVRALNEVGQTELAAKVSGMKKADAARETAGGLEGRNWLPSVVKPKQAA